MNIKARSPFVYSLAITVGIGVAFLICGCDETEPPAPPIERSPGGVTNDTLPTRPEPEPELEPCPWLGTCAELEQIDACEGWAVACGDGWRCIDTEAEAGIVCEDPSSSSGSAPGDSESTT